MKRSIWIASGVVVLVLLLAGVAFMGGRLLSRQSPQESVDFVQTGGEGGESMIAAKDGAQPIFEDPEEKPEERPTVIGVFKRRDDNSLFVGTNLTGEGVGLADGSIKMKYNGPVVEIVVTHDTEIYKEKLDIDTRQTTWEPGSLDDINNDAIIIAWGEKRGDRTVARVLAYNPMRFELP